MNAATPDNLHSGRAATYWGLPLGWASLAYIVGVPLLTAVYAGINNWEIRHAIGFSGSLIFYAAHAFLPWWTTCLSTAMFKKLLEQWKPSWPLILFFGHCLGSTLVLPYSNWVTGFYEGTSAGFGVTHPETQLFSWDFWNYFVRAGVIWFGINFLFDRFFGLPLYRYAIPRGYDNGMTQLDSVGEEAPSTDNWPDREPLFVSRLPQNIGPGDLIAIKAEQHYIKVFGPEKNQMVLYRFSDAVTELPPDLGKQVHRSYWVNTTKIDSVHAKAKDFYLTMTNGAQIPVSGPYQGMVRELARNLNIETKV